MPKILLRMDRCTCDYLLQYSLRCRDKSVTFLETDTGQLPVAVNDFSFKYEPYFRSAYIPDRIMNLHEEICLFSFSRLVKNEYLRIHHILWTKKIKRYDDFLIHDFLLIFYENNQIDL